MTNKEAIEQLRERHTAKCPVCGYEFDFGTWNENHHCICGQAMDWSEERGE